MLGAFGSSARGAPLRRSDESGAGAANFTPGASARASDEKAGAFGVIERAAERLEQVIDQETAALQTRGGVDLKDFNDRKSLGLLELTRAMRHIEGTAPDQALQSRLTRLRNKLEINRAALKMHLDAVREISTILSDAMRNAESDGTYSPSIRGGRTP
jgi:hypothetical protein